MIERKLLKDILKERGIQQKVIAEALGIDRINISRYNDLLDRKVSEVLIISKTIGVPFSELIGIDNMDMKNIDQFIIKYPDNPNRNQSALIESMKETIEALKKTISAKDELIESLKRK